MRPGKDQTSMIAPFNAPLNAPMHAFRKIALAASTFLAPVALATPALAQDALPTGEVVRAGAVTIDRPNATTLNINQTSDRAVVNWSTFNVGEGHTVNFNHLDWTGAPANTLGATLNRVTSATASTIAGRLAATGSVYLINPNGIQITGTGTVDVGRGFVASTLDITDADFLNGKHAFSGKGGRIEHRGTIRSLNPLGFVALLGGELNVGGTILAPSGTVMIGGTTRNTLDLNGGGFLQVVLPGDGILSGDGMSSVALSQDAARAAVRHIVNLPPSVEATAVAGATGNVTLTGRITAAGGHVTVSTLGDIALNGAVIDVRSSGANTNIRGSVTLRADAGGTGTGTVLYSGSPLIRTEESGRVDVYYNPTSYTAPENYALALDGLGDRQGWMLVHDIYDLQAIQTNLSGKYALSRDIDARGTATWNNRAGFMPLGWDKNAGFDGILDGQGHVISDLVIDQPDLITSGLFGYITDGSVRNLGLLGGSVRGGLTHTGQLAGYLNGFIVNVYSTGQVTGGGNAGGLAGFVENSVVRTSYSTASVSGAIRAGGLAGYAVSTAIDQTYASGPVDGAGTNGGLIGEISGSTKVTRSYWDSYSTAQTAGFGVSTSGATAASLLEVSSDPVFALPESERPYAFTSGAYANFDRSVWYFAGTGVRPLLRSEFSHTITNSHQLQLMGMDTQASYILTRTINLRETSRAAFKTPFSRAGIWDHQGFSPIGQSSLETSMPFSGLLDGLGNSITDLTINRANERQVGLFGSISGGEVRNLSLIAGSITARAIAGALAGEVDAGILRNVHSSVSVTGNELLGGLAGAFYGTLADALSATGTITGSLDQIGGLFGVVDGVVTNSYASGAVRGRSGVGGLIGELQGGLVQNTYANGTVTGTDAVGGLIGKSSNGRIETSYAAGAVSGTSSTGGLIGSASSTSSIDRSYWDTYATGQAQAFAAGSLIEATSIAAVTSDPAKSGDANYAYKASAWSNWAAEMDRQGGQDRVWRIYEGYTMPLLKALLKPLAVQSSGRTSVVYDGQQHTLALFYPTNTDTMKIFGSATLRGTNAGTYRVGPGLYSNQQGYDLVTDPITLTITPRSLTVTADALSRVYGEANPALTYTIGGLGLVNGDTLTGALATAALAGSNVGTYAIGQGSLAATSNYALTFVGANLAVTPRALDIIADAKQRLANTANPALTYTARGLYGADTLTGALATAAAPSSPAGTYAITLGSLNAGANYTIRYTGADLTVQPDTTPRFSAGQTPASRLLARTAFSPSLDQHRLEIAFGTTGSICPELRSGDNSARAGEADSREDTISAQACPNGRVPDEAR